MGSSLIRSNFPLLILVGATLVGSLAFLIWRSWNSETTSGSEQKALLKVALNAVLAPALTLAVALIFRPTLGVVGAAALLATVLSLALLARAHGAL